MLNIDRLDKLGIASDEFIKICYNATVVFFLVPHY